MNQSYVIKLESPGLPSISIQMFESNTRMIKLIQGHCNIAFLIIYMQIKLQKSTDEVQGIC